MLTLERSSSTVEDGFVLATRFRMLNILHYYKRAFYCITQETFFSSYLVEASEDCVVFRWCRSILQSIFGDQRATQTRIPTTEHEKKNRFGLQKREHWNQSVTVGMCSRRLNSMPR